MRRIALTLLIFCLITAFFVCFVYAEESYTAFKMPFKKLLSEPRKDANLVYEIPVDVKLLGISADKNWYKVCIEFDIIFIGHHKFTGWVFAPIEDQIKLAEEKEVTKQAQIK